MKSYVVEFYSRIFQVLSWASPFNIIRKLIPSLKNHDAFIDSWVLIHLVLAAVILFFSSASAITVCELVFIIYGGIRIFEIVIYQINVLIFDQYRKEIEGKQYSVRSYRRSLILAVHNYFEVLIWFAIFYRNFFDSFISKFDLNTINISLYYSLVTMSTLGYGDIAPRTTEARMMVFTHTVIAIFLTLMILARFISLLPKPKTRSEHEKNNDN